MERDKKILKLKERNRDLKKRVKYFKKVIGTLQGGEYTPVDLNCPLLLGRVTYANMRQVVIDLASSNKRITKRLTKLETKSKLENNNV